jgi:calcineurin-like phosphoesterase
MPLGRTVISPSSGCWMPAEDRQERGLAGAVGPDHGHQLAATGGQRHSPQRRSIAVALDEVARASVTVAVSTARRLAESPAVKLLFVGDVVGGIGRRTFAALLPAIRDAHQPDFVVGERRERGRRRGHHAEDGAGAARIGSRRDHPRQPRVPAPGGVRAARSRAADRATGQLPDGEPRPRAHGVERDGVRLGYWTCPGRCYLEAARSPFADGDAALVRAERQHRRVARGHAREATSEKVGNGLVPGRTRHGLRGHAHARATADARVLPAGPPTSPSGYDGPARRGDRREARVGLERFLTMTAVRFETSDEDPWPERRADRGRRRRARDGHRAAADPRGALAGKRGRARRVHDAVCAARGGSARSRRRGRCSSEPPRRPPAARGRRTSK